MSNLDIIALVVSSAVLGWLISKFFQVRNQTKADKKEFEEKMADINKKTSELKEMLKRYEDNDGK